jgi:hypothetical protein
MPVIKRRRKKEGRHSRKCRVNRIKGRIRKRMAYIDF